MKGTWSSKGVRVTAAQFRKAIETGDNWWLDVVENLDGAEGPKLTPLPNPFVRADGFWLGHAWRETSDAPVLDQFMSDIPQAGDSWTNDSGDRMSVTEVRRHGRIVELVGLRPDGSTWTALWGSAWRRA